MNQKDQKQEERKSLPAFVFENKWVSFLSFLLVLGIMFGTYAFRQEMEEYLGLGGIGLALGCFLSNATVFFPAPSLLLVGQFALIYGVVFAGVVGSFGTTCGEMVGYFMGYTGKNFVDLDQKWLGPFKKHPNLCVFAFSLLPLPVFDVIGVIAGATSMNILRFFVVCWAGKCIKMWLFALFFVWGSHYVTDVNGNFDMSSFFTMTQQILDSMIS